MDLSLDLTDLDVGDPGSWPGTVKALCFAAIGIAVVGLGYLLMIADKRAELARVEWREHELRDEFDGKRSRASSLDAHRLQHDEAQAAFAVMTQRLPRDTEVPGLIDDMTHAAIANNLVIDRIDLGEERRVAGYLELPIAIAVAGDYPDLAAFVGGIAGLPRRVTLHDFDLAPRTGPGNLLLSIEARTYRHGREPESEQPLGLPK